MTKPRTRWRIVKSTLNNFPTGVVGSLPEVRDWLQRQADSPSRRDPYGPLSYRYELADDDQTVTVIHCYFINRNQIPTRFMRLERVQ